MKKDICTICEKEVTEAQGTAGWNWSINAAVRNTGMPLIIYGHKTCLENVNMIIVANRRFVDLEIEAIKK